MWPKQRVLARLAATMLPRSGSIYHLDIGSSKSSSARTRPIGRAPMLAEYEMSHWIREMKTHLASIKVSHAIGWIEMIAGMVQQTRFSTCKP